MQLTTRVITFLALVLSGSAFAQMDVSGKCVDINNKPIPGVVVTAKQPGLVSR